ncbi:MAG: bifunctional methylenetetrahydrofolate dehydrogenase/methenyltetrahydrofolate cyclohydrolase FolD [Flavobacteriales bacterium]|nr:bifunctional methylenetetrahydrofolate dehydrogenase/methenyltetrahydrofolate cyclohydrolase FolD [Flavobacteriales bacterium]
MQILDGKKTSLQIQDEIRDEVIEIKASGSRPPHLVAILVGDNGASETYVRAKVKACKRVGFESTLIRLESNVSQCELIAIIEKINNDENHDGLIVQLPLPTHIDEKIVTSTINPNIDVDGFHESNLGKLMLNIPSFLPATPYGILELLKRYKVETSGKHCVVLGRSNIVGTPISLMMSRNKFPGNCTVTLTHSKTKDLVQITRQADILIVALGKSEFINSDMIKSGVCIVDVGITRVKSNKTKNGWKLLGDVNYDNVKEKCSYITPVPGGVGPMTIAMLLKNTLSSFRKDFLV